MHQQIEKSLLIYWRSTTKRHILTNSKKHSLWPIFWGKYFPNRNPVNPLSFLTFNKKPPSISLPLECQSADLSIWLSSSRWNLKTSLSNFTYKDQKHELTLARLICTDKNNKIYAYQKNDKEWLSGQWEVPTVILRSTDGNLKQYPRTDIDFGKPVGQFKTGITKYKIGMILVARNSRWPHHWGPLKYRRMWR